jgi:hypothetical protein
MRALVAVATLLFLCAPLVQALYSASGQVTELNESNFDTKLRRGAWLVEFYAPWFAPARLLTGAAFCGGSFEPSSIGQPSWKCAQEYLVLCFLVLQWLAAVGTAKGACSLACCRVSLHQARYCPAA